MGTGRSTALSLSLFLKPLHHPLLPPLLLSLFPSLISSLSLTLTLLIPSNSPFLSLSLFSLFLPSSFLGRCALINIFSSSRASFAQLLASRLFRISFSAFIIVVAFKTKQRCYIFYCGFPPHSFPELIAHAIICSSCHKSCTVEPNIWYVILSFKVLLCVKLVNITKFLIVLLLSFQNIAERTVSILPM